ncbi:kinase-like domain-containing protein [Gigaspora rosea]|uniref:dual-specificity kinase n=1 Tax=Gigaspora rosea TaxID=44941 RepID=A0A397UVD6_9GLOM|nr:kinase-like domain-containing protein [Gigaspora rosea]
MSTVTMSNTRPIKTSRQKRPHNPNWREDFYRNGRPDEKEVIVISDSPTPPLSSTRQRPAQMEAARGMKRNRRTPLLSSNKSAQMLHQQASASAHKRRRRGEYRDHSHYNDTAYRSYISTSSHASGRYREPISTRESRSSAASSRQAIPSYDDKDGHYIVKIGDELGNKYQITHLLGQGTFGKVVQCWDRVSNRHVAIKIIRAVQKYRDASKIEIRVLNTLRDRDPANVHKCIHLREWFDYRNHICMVFDLYGSSLFDFLKHNDFNPLPINQIQHVARQLLHSVAFLHSLRLVHTDLKPENILLVNDQCRTVPSRRSPGKSRRILLDTDIRLIDFGSATFDDEYHSSVVSTRHYRAPEVILGLGWSYACDLWSIGCILVELFTGEALFQTHENLEHLAMMEHVLGRIPERIVRQMCRPNQLKYFRGSRLLNYPNDDTTKQSRKYVKSLHTLEEVIGPRRSTFREQFYDLLQRLLLYDPEERISARDALRHPFFYMTFDEEGRQIR